MDHPDHSYGHRRDPGLGHRRGVGLALVPQWVVLAGENQRRRKSGKIVRARRGHVRVRAIHARGCHALPEERHLRGGESETDRILAVGLSAHLRVDDRIDQGLEQVRRDAAVSGTPGDDGRDVATGTVAEQCQPPAMDARYCALAKRCRHGLDIVQRGRIRMFGCQPVIDGYDVPPGLRGDHPADGVVGVQAASYPAAAVHVDDRGQDGIG